MRYGLNLGACVDPRTLAEWAALAEDAGWDGVFLEDYIVYQGRQDIPTYDPWVALAAMAVRTERIRLGTEVTPLARRRPWKVAREAVTLDHLSGGRLVLGVGTGDARSLDFANFGEVTDARTRAGMLDEALQVLVGLWSGEPFSHEGEHYRVRDVTFLPRPVQRPRIPIWVGGAYPHRRPMRRAARWDGYCVYRWTEDGHWEDLTAAEVQAAKAFIESRRPVPGAFDIVAGGTERRPDWERERELIASLAGAGATWWTEWVPPLNQGEMRARMARGPLRVD